MVTAMPRRRDWFSSPRRRLASAKKKLAKLQRGFQSFFDRHPERTVIEDDADGIDELYKLKFTKALPESLSKLTSEIVEDLRSALDQTGCSVARAKGIARPKASYFPFGNCITNLNNTINTKCGDLPNEIKSLFRNFKPYKGGDDFLWALNGLCNTSKHCFIEPIGLATSSAHINHLCVSTNKEFSFPPKWNWEKAEMIWGIYPKGSKPSYNFQLSLVIAFGEVEIVGGKPVDGVLHALVRKVEGIILATEAECKRIGLI